MTICRLTTTTTTENHYLFVFCPLRNDFWIDILLINHENNKKVKYPRVKRIRPTFCDILSRRLIVRERDCPGKWLSVREIVWKRDCPRDGLSEREIVWLWDAGWVNYSVLCHNIPATSTSSTSMIILLLIPNLLRSFFAVKKTRFRPTAPRTNGRTDGRTDRQRDRRTDPLIEMRGRI